MSQFYHHFLKDKTIREIFPGLARRTLISFPPSTPTHEVLKTFEDELILSAPIISIDGKICGIADHHKLVLFALGLASLKSSKEDFQSSLSKQPSNLVLGERFEKTPIGDVVVGMDSLYTHDPFFTISFDDSIEQLVDLFYHGVHRVIVLRDKKAIGILSQSDLLWFLSTNRVLLESDTANHPNTVKDLKLIKDKEAPITIGMNDLVVNAFHLMGIHNVSSLPIVENGRIKAVFSSSNIRGLNQLNFGDLQKLTVRQYLENQSEHAKEVFVRLHARRALRPVTCTENTTFQSVLSTLAAERLHRIFVVGEENKLLNVLSLGDIFQVFLPWGAPQKFE